MSAKKGKKPAGVIGGGGEKAVGNGIVDPNAGPEPPLTKVYESTKLSVTCNKGTC